MPQASFRKVALTSMAVLMGCGDGEGLASGTCEEREVAIELMAEIGGEDDGGMLFSTVTSVSYLADGRMAVFDWHDVGRVRVHEPDGRWAFHLGQPGQGPGELSRPAFTHLDQEGNFLVIDPRRRRLTRFSEDGRAVETIRLPPVATVTRVLPLPDDRMLISGQLPTDESIGLPLHIVASDGSLVRSFGGEVSGRWDAGGFNRVTSRASDGRVWVAPRYEYRLELWDLEGALLRTLDEEPEWFISSQEARRIPRSPDAPDPPSSMVGVWEEGGCLLVASNVARRDWPDRLEEVDEDTPGPRRYTYPGHPTERLFRTRVQVLDPETGEQLAVADAPTGFTGLRTSGPPDSHVIGFSNHLVREEPRLRFWTISMVRP